MVRSPLLLSRGVRAHVTRKEGISSRTNSHHHTIQTINNNMDTFSTVLRASCIHPSSPHAYFQDGEVSGEEFKQAVKDACVGKTFEEFPNAFRMFIVNQFKTVDVNGMCDTPTCLSRIYVSPFLKIIPIYLPFNFVSKAVSLPQGVTQTFHHQGFDCEHILFKHH